MKRTNTVADALNTNLAQVDPGDGLPIIPIPLDGKMPGYPGPPGPGVPEGGTVGQYIEKTSDGSTQWATLSKSKVGLSNVDNTSDADKPISDATQIALDAKPSRIELDAKADLTDGKVPIEQIPTAATVTDSTVSAQINAPLTGAAIDGRINTQVTPVVEQITADYIASDSTIVDAAAAAVDANPTIAELEQAKWFQGEYPGGDVFTHGTQGMYFVPSGEGIPNWPSELSGVGGYIEFNSRNGIKSIEIRSYGARPYTFSTQSNSVMNNTFHPWERSANSSEVAAAKWFKGSFPGSDVFTWGESGAYYVSEEKASTLANWPEEMSGVGGFLDIEVSDGRVTASVKGYGLRPYTFNTYKNSVLNNTFHPWEREATMSDVEAISAAIEPIGLNRDVLKAAFTKRRGGRIGVQGKAVVALRFDDPINGLINSAVDQALLSLDIPASAVHCSGSFTAPDLIALSNLGTWQTVIDWAHKQGMEVWHHGGDHQDASTPAALTDEIVTSLATLKSNLPTLEVNKWAQPGVGGTNYDGFALLDSPELFYGHKAGKLIAQGHAVASGPMNAEMRQLDGQPRDGVGHYTVDNPAALAAAYTRVAEAVKIGAGLNIMLHPNNLDRAGDFSTSADFIAFLEHLAQLRDEGKIEILTMSGLLCADASTTHRSQVIRNADLSAPLSEDYTGATGWTQASGVASTDGTEMLQQIHSAGRYGWMMGGTMQLVAKVRATSGAVVRLQQSSYADPVAWTAQRNATLPASPDWQTVRINACVPTNLASTDYVATSIGRLSGGTLEVDSIEYLPV